MLTTTGNFCLKSPENSTVKDPLVLLHCLKSFKVQSSATIVSLWAIVHSSHMIIEQLRITLAIEAFLEMEKTRKSMWSTLMGISDGVTLSELPGSKILQ